ncbi:MULTISPECIES: hypothetical protein [Anaeromyxobacter]|uniref:hypothetical protein n=1 Tax=Anaeromyxobacter TaxID=161492 RepID=UPI001F56CDA0|nr:MULTISPECIES: hypothetical protein [unclassified Anaeromyxobacter]
MKRLGLAASLLGVSLIGAEYRSAAAAAGTPAEDAPAAVPVTATTARVHPASPRASGSPRSAGE